MSDLTLTSLWVLFVIKYGLKEILEFFSKKDHLAHLLRAPHAF